MKLKEKIVLITGGRGSLGEAFVEGLLKEGAIVICTYRNRDNKLTPDLKKDGKKHFSIPIDLSEISEINILLNILSEKFKSIDILINNAGVLFRSDFLSSTQQELEYIMAVNFYAPYTLIQGVSKQMIKHKRKGSIINISSTSAVSTDSGITHYECSKAALEMLTKSSACQLASYGIRVNSIMPGITQSNMNKEQWGGDVESWEKRTNNIPLGRAGKPRDHWGALLFFCLDDSSWITGATLTIDGGMLAS